MDEQGAFGGRHIGPMAEAWSASFGGTDAGIPVQEAFGISLKGLQELLARVERIEQHLGTGR